MPPAARRVARHRPGGTGVGAGEIVEVEEPLGTVKALDPIMKSIAQQGMRIRPRR
ncbi:uvrD/Rep family helicase domain protein [Mycobacterium xenopi 3993]|nr:uvrD/Rep family helicase domain protein [Mycobacterium xenopi 3993]